MDNINEAGKKSFSLLTVGILAGGTSRRFGSPKHLAELGGKSFLQSAYHTARQLSSYITISCGQQKITLGSTPGVYDWPDLPGPAGGIAALLKAAQTPWLLTLPVDMPLLKPKTLNMLFEERLSAKPVSFLVGGKPEPLVTIWPKAIVDVFLEKAPTCNYRIKDILKDLHVHYIGIESKEKEIEFSNVNDQTDLLKLQQHPKIEQQNE